MLVGMATLAGLTPSAPERERSDVERFVSGGEMECMGESCSSRSEDECVCWW